MRYPEAGASCSRRVSKSLVCKHRAVGTMVWSVAIKEVHAVASWTWGAGEEGDVCSICRSPFDGCPPDCKVPGDDAPVVWGKCSHAFHIQCIQKCIDTETNGQSDRQANCPNCRTPWEFEAADTGEAADAGEDSEPDVTTMEDIEHEPPEDASAST